MTPRETRENLGVMFDVKPVTATGEVDVAKIQAVTAVVDLRSTPLQTDLVSKQNQTEVRLIALPPVSTLTNPVVKQSSPIKAVAPISEVNIRSELSEHFRQALTSTAEPATVLAAVGGKLHTTQLGAVGRRNLVPTNLELDFYNKPARLALQENIRPATQPNLVNLTEVGPRSQWQPYAAESPLRRPASRRITPATKELNYWREKIESAPAEAVATLASLPSTPPGFVKGEWASQSRNCPSVEAFLTRHETREEGQGNSRAQRAVQHRHEKREKGGGRRDAIAAKQYRHWGVKSRWLFAVAGLVILTGAGSQLGLKQKVLQSSSQAVANIESAKADITSMQFAKAADSFALAYDNFSQASGTLDVLGNSLTSLIASVPGMGQLKSAQNVLEIGREMSAAGRQVALALDKFYQTNWTAFLGYNPGKRPQSISNLVRDFQTALVFAQDKVNHSNELLAVVDVATVPADKQAQLNDLKDKLPVLKGFIDNAVDYANFLLAALGEEGPKKYLLLFENNAELRPAGGFPGSYALVGFNRGLLSDLKVDDIYNIDGQAKINLIPPKELQHITPTWGMRDANWWADFPTSAKKIMELYHSLDGGPTVDGVLVITPTIINRIMKITGPIALPQYGLTLDSTNFLTAIQSEVEYGANRVEPKQILMDFAPHFIKQLGQQDKAQWSKILQIILAGVDEKQVLAYFSDPVLESTVQKNNLAGEVKAAPDDYLSIVHTNVKGSKTDAVIKNNYSLAVKQLSDGSLEHTLTINRTHTGGKEKFGFYNRKNPDFIRVFVPAGAQFEEISGQTPVAYPLLISYALGEFSHDPDLVKYEAGREKPASGVESFKESGKQVFAFWLETDVQESRTVTLRYTVPPAADGQYALLWQKQAGTLGEQANFAFTPASGRQVIYQYPDLKLNDGTLTTEQVLTKDWAVGVKFQ